MTLFSDTARARQPKGSPAGGQYAAMNRAEADLDLTSPVTAVFRTVDPDGMIVYTNSAGHYHRTDGPAITNSRGDQTWYWQGAKHRADGPAVECTDGTREWWINGKLHRTDGPAVEYVDGDTEWWVNGTQIPAPQSRGNGVS